MRNSITPLPFKFFHNQFLRDFLKCGITGWCLEIIFTAIGALRRREMQLVGQTSLYMFPIYGCAAVFKPLFIVIRRFAPVTRGLIYALFIFLGEFVSGTILENRSLCPWNYSRHRWHIKGLIRLDFLPFWFIAGLLFERILTRDTARRDPSDHKYSANC